MPFEQENTKHWWTFSCFASHLPSQELWMEQGITKLLSFKAGNNQNFVLIKTGRWRTGQVHTALDMLDLVPTAYMEFPKIIGFSQHEMYKHEMVKLIKEAERSGDDTFVHWSAAAAFKLTKELTVNLKDPIHAPEGSQRERKAPDRLQMIEEPKKPRRQEPSPDQVQCSADTESDEDEEPDAVPSSGPVPPPEMVQPAAVPSADVLPADEEIAAQLVRCREKAMSVDKRPMVDGQTLDDFVPEKRARVDDHCAQVDDIEAYATREKMEEAHKKDLEPAQLDD
jgi:hypothetical protein